MHYAFEVEDRLYTRLKFAGKEFPFLRVNSVNFIHMSASAKIGVPMFHLSVNDPNGYFEREKILGDGIPVEISVAPRPDSPIVHTYEFRINSVNKQHTNPNTTYEIDGYLNKPKYWHNTTRQWTEGLASDVLSGICDECDLEYDGESTADYQVWWPGNRRYFEWAWYVARRAYLSDSASLELGLDFDGKLKLKDITRLDVADYQMSFMEPRPGFILATDIQPTTRSGSPNHLSGYQDARVYQKLMNNAAEFNVYDNVLEVAPTKGERSFTRNKVIQGETTAARTQFGPLDFGNTHPKYERAIYQNARMDALFGLTVAVVTPEATNVKLFDNVEIVINYPEDPYKPRYSRHLSGIYKVVSKAIYINGMNYYERFVMSRRAYGEETAEN